MGIYRRGPLPQGGETVYRVVRVHEWIAASYQPTFLGLLRLIFRDEIDSEAYFGPIKLFLGKVHAEFETKTFRNGLPGSLEMGHGEWVERQLRICVNNRVNMLRLHPVWASATPARKVMYVARMVFEAMIRVGVVRGFGYHGLAVPKDRPFIAIDERGNEHVIATHAAPPVLGFGPGPL
jgi:hypothetical protein